LNEEAIRLLAWEEISMELPTINIDENQRTQLSENLRKAKGDLKEIVWRTYKNVLLLGKDNALRHLDMGLVHSSAADSVVQFLLNHLKQADEIQSGISPNFLVRNWPPAFTEWSTRLVRDAFYASPKFPRLLNPDALKNTIVRGVHDGLLAYVGKTSNGKYQPFIFEREMQFEDVEISDETFLITQETAKAHKEAQLQASHIPVPPETPKGEAQPPLTIPSTEPRTTILAAPSPSPKLQAVPSGFGWTGEVPPQKWMNFYTRVLSKFSTGSGLTIKLQFNVAPEAGVSEKKIDEVKAALRELGLNDKLD
jgi:hypothetical protein